MTSGIVNYALGVTIYQCALSGANIILVFFNHIYIRLQHSHLWIAFRGLAGKTTGPSLSAESLFTTE